jgi:hypothetical protein
LYNTNTTNSTAGGVGNSIAQFHKEAW